jgi:hypothetical protein
MDAKHNQYIQDALKLFIRIFTQIRRAQTLYNLLLVG